MKQGPDDPRMYTRGSGIVGISIIRYQEGRDTPGVPTKRYIMVRYDIGVLLAVDSGDDDRDDDDDDVDRDTADSKDAHDDCPPRARPDPLSGDTVPGR